MCLMFVLLYFISDYINLAISLYFYLYLFIDVVHTLESREKLKTQMCCKVLLCVLFYVGMLASKTDEAVNVNCEAFGATNNNISYFYMEIYFVLLQRHHHHYHDY